MTLEIELPVNAQADLIKLSAATGIAIEDVAFLLMALGAKCCEANPELVAKMKAARVAALE